MKTQVEFTSEHFGAYADEFEIVNPDRWGKRLAEFLSKELQARNIVTETEFAEDFGWVIPIQNESFPLSVVCGNLDGSSNKYVVFIDPSTPTVKRGFFKRVSTVPQVSLISSALEDILVNSEIIDDILWF